MLTYCGDLEFGEKGDLYYTGTYTGHIEATRVTADPYNSEKGYTEVDVDDVEVVFFEEFVLNDKTSDAEKIIICNKILREAEERLTDVAIDLVNEGDE